MLVKCTILIKICCAEIVSNWRKLVYRSVNSLDLSRAGVLPIEMLRRYWPTVTPANSVNRRDQ